MEKQLSSLSKIFTERIYRIPDCQRGYAWTEKQLKDFLGDLDQLEHGKNHYLGVLTLEEVSERKYQEWRDDLWIINDKSYVPYHIVDGQQRLTTAIVLIQAIIQSTRESHQNLLDEEFDEREASKIEEDISLNYSTLSEIKKSLYTIQETKEFLGHIYLATSETIPVMNS